jgi:cytochrome c556
MRFVGLGVAGAALLVAGCGDWKSGQANNAQGNISNESRVADTANSTAVVAANNMMLLAAAPPKDRALKIMHERHEAMEGLGKAMKTLHRELDSDKPDINVIRAQTSTMAATAAKIPSLFPAGTGPNVGKTRAKREIWKQQDLFLRRSKEYLAAARAIDAAAITGDLKKVMALHENVDKACKACHDPFRAPEH